MRPPGEEDPSYPPAFRRAEQTPERDGGKFSGRSGLEIFAGEAEIVTLDLENLDPGRLRRACAEMGIFRLANHGVPVELLNRVCAEVRRLLSLPFDEKERRFPPPMKYLWGTPVVSQRVKSVNWVEGLDVPLGLLASSGTGTAAAALPDDDDVASFRSMLVEYGAHMARIARKLFNSLAVDLGLDGDQVTSYLSESEGTLRLYRYPRCPDPCNHSGMDAHTDSSVLSILVERGGGGGGLQVNFSGTGERWLDVRPISSYLVVNLGDMMQAISGDEYCSVRHRVAASVVIEERVSVCYFAFPRDDAVITSSKYVDFTYPEFRSRVQEDIRVLGVKVGLDRFRVSFNAHGST